MLHLTKSGKIRRKSDILTYSTYYDAHYKDKQVIQNLIIDPIIFIASSNEDENYYHQVIRKYNCMQFFNSMVDELNDELVRVCWSLVLVSIFFNTTTPYSVWSMKRKREFISRKIYNWKSVSLCMGGGGVNKRKVQPTTTSTPQWWDSSQSYYSLPYHSSMDGTKEILTLSYIVHKHQYNLTSTWRYL